MRELSHTLTPRARHILLIIFLGGSSMIITKKLLVNDVRLSGHKTEYIAVQDSDKVVNSTVVTAVDTITAVYHKTTKTDTAGLKNIKTTRDLPYKALFFEYNSVFLVWMALISIMMGISFALAPVVIKAIRDIVRIFNISAGMVWLCFAIVIAMAVLIVYTQQNNHMMQAFEIMDKFKILLNHPEKLNIVVLINLGVGLIAIAGQLIINCAVSKLPDSVIGLSDDQQKKMAGKFMLLRNQLKFFLLIDAILIVFSILTTDALRRSILTEITFNIDIFPSNFVYLYGLLFTFFLGLLYLPVYYRLRYKGTTMLFDVPQKEIDGDKKATFNAFLIQETPVQSLQVALAILAPVLTSLAPNILKL
ncbi:MAG TPA: hypothetical protein VHA56_15175 [Mucilaginibacter sp.]|nr:hypothetical protein [Mucilaginibacter sp.]